MFKEEQGGQSVWNIMSEGRVQEMRSEMGKEDLIKENLVGLGWRLDSKGDRTHWKRQAEN